MNRFTISMGEKIGSKVQATTNQGVVLTYDWTSQRVSAQYTDTKDGHIPHTEQYTYTADGYLEDTRINYGSGWVLQARRTSDGLGCVTAYEEWNSNGTKKLTRRTEYNIDSQATVIREWDGSIGDWNNPLRKTTSTFSNTGMLIRQDYQDLTPNKNLTTTKDYKYVWWDEAKESKITVTGVTQVAYQGYWAPGYARFIYDVNGHISAMNDPSYNNANASVYTARSVWYTTDAQGRILMRMQIGDGRPNLNGTVVDQTTSGDKMLVHKFFYLNGRGVGDVGTDGMRRMSYAEALAIPTSNNNDDRYGKSWTPVMSADFDANYEPITADYPTTAPGTYTVQSGDTLQSIAAATWGDSAMWYLIADANGLSGSEVLVADQVLAIPNKVANIHNNSGTYRVFNAALTMGNTDPTLPPLPAPPPPPRSKKHCGGIGTILIAVVAIVAAVYTAGAALAYFAPAASGAAAAAGVGATTAATMAAGGSMALSSIGALAGMMSSVGFGMATVAAGAIGAAVGSIVSQGLGMAMGMQDKFSWGQVGVAAIGGAVTAGLNATGFASTASRYLGDVGSAVAQAAAGNAVTQGISVATGLQERFSWTQVAASAAGSLATHAVGGTISRVGQAIGLTSKFANGVFTGTSLGLLNGGIQSAITYRKPDWAAIAMDSFGSSLGNALVENQILTDSKKLQQQSELAALKVELRQSIQQDIEKTRAQVALDLQIQNDLAGELLRQELRGFDDISMPELDLAADEPMYNPGAVKLGPNDRYSKYWTAKMDQGMLAPSDADIERYRKRLKMNFTDGQNELAALARGKLEVLREGDTVTLRAVAPVFGPRAQEFSEAAGKAYNVSYQDESDGKTYRMEVSFPVTNNAKNAAITLEWGEYKDDRSSGMANGTIHMDTSANTPKLNAGVVDHEIGHAFFGLADGYSDIVRMEGSKYMLLNVTYSGMEGSIMAANDGVIRLQDLKALINVYEPLLKERQKSK